MPTPNPHPFAERAASAAIRTLREITTFNGYWQALPDSIRAIMLQDVALAIRDQADRTDLPDEIERDLSGRHPSTVQMLTWFDVNRPSLSVPLQLCSIIANHAYYLAAVLPDGPELTTGLRKLLEARECFIRASVQDRL